MLALFPAAPPPNTNGAGLPGAEPKPPIPVAPGAGLGALKVNGLPAPLGAGALFVLPLPKANVGAGELGWFAALLAAPNVKPVEVAGDWT